MKCKPTNKGARHHPSSVLERMSWSHAKEERRPCHTNYSKQNVAKTRWKSYQCEIQLFIVTVWSYGLQVTDVPVMVVDEFVQTDYSDFMSLDNSCKATHPQGRT